MTSLWAQGVLSTNLAHEDPHYKALLREPMYWIVSLTGLRAVPIFFMVSGFFSTLISLRTPLGEYRSIGLLRWSTARYVRLVSICVPNILWSLIRFRAFWIDDEGKFMWDKLRGWITLTGNYNGGRQNLTWFFDPTLTASWSNAVDLQASIVLFLVCRYLLRSRVEDVGRAMWALLAISILLRACLLWRDPPCTNLALFIPDAHPIHFISGLPYPARSYAEESMGMAVPLDYGKPSLTDCHGATVLAALLSYTRDLYVSTHARIEPFFVGAIAACNYFRFSSDGAKSTAKGAWIWWSLSFFFVVFNLFAPIDIDHLPPANVLLSVDTVGTTLLASAVAFLAYGGIVPENHPYHSPLTVKLASFPLIKHFATISPWVYVIHWPVLNELIRLVLPRFDPATRAEFLTFPFTVMVFAVILTIACPLAILCHRLFDPAIARLTHFLKYPDKKKLK